MKNILILITASVILFASSASALNVTLANWVDDNKSTNANQGYWTTSNDGLTLIAGGQGAGMDTSSTDWLGWSTTSGTSYDGFGAGTNSASHGDSNGIMDSQYLRLGNSGNQRKLDFMVVNNTGGEITLDGFGFDWQNPHANGMSFDYIAGPTSAAANANSNLINSSGVELNNQANIELKYSSNSITTSSASLGTLANGDGAAFRIIYTLANTRGLDNLTVHATATPVPEVSHFGLLTGAIVLAFAARRRRA